MTAPRMVLGILPQPFEDSDAPAIIGLAASLTVMIAAAGHNDEAVAEAVMKGAAISLDRMRPEAKALLETVANELLDATRKKKGFMVLGGFGAGPERTPQASDQLWAAATAMAAIDAEMKAAQQTMAPLRPIDPSDYQHLTPAEQDSYNRALLRWRSAAAAFADVTDRIIALARARPGDA